MIVDEQFPYAYGDIFRGNQYTPWVNHQEFRSVLRSIQGHTLVDFHRCYELFKLVEQSSKYSSGSLIEVGVWRGGSGALIAQVAKKCGIKNTVFLCDTFTGVVKTSDKDSMYKGGEHADTSREIAENLIFNNLKLDNVTILEGVFPDDSGTKIENLDFRFCHIDVDVYQSAKDVNEWVWDRMITGGIIVYDDYGFVGCDGVTKYVNEQYHLNDRIVLYNLNGHAIVIKT